MTIKHRTIHRMLSTLYFVQFKCKNKVKTKETYKKLKKFYIKLLKLHNHVQ